MSDTLTLSAAIAALDATIDDQWTSNGAPAMGHIKTITGDDTITRKQVTDAAPTLTRETLTAFLDESADDKPKHDPRLGPDAGDGEASGRDSSKVPPSAITLLGSYKQPATFKRADGSEFALGDAVAKAHETSGLEAAAWNELDDDARESAIEKAVNELMVVEEKDEPESTGDAELDAVNEAIAEVEATLDELRGVEAELKTSFTEAEAELDKLNAKRTELLPTMTAHEAVQAAIASSAQDRETRAARRDAVLQGAAPLDAAFARKKGFGRARPNYNLPQKTDAKE